MVNPDHAKALRLQETGRALRDFDTADLDILFGVMDEATFEKFFDRFKERVVKAGI
jgi:hypothetical protein